MSLEDLLTKVKQKDFDVFLQQYERLSNLIGQKEALIVLNSAIQQGFLWTLEETPNQSFLNKTSNKSSKPQIKNLFPQQKEKKNNIQALLQENFERIKQQTQSFLSDCKANKYCFMTEKQLASNFKLIQNYLKSYDVLPKEKIRNKYLKLQGMHFNQSNQTMLDYINLVDSALFYTTKNHRLRITQILAIALFLYRGDLNRVLLQILTGEGKSVTISCIAAILTISGLNVDIVTTNEILAKRDVDQKKKFFQLLGLNVAHNFEQNQTGPKKCYKDKAIVYGTPHSFQVDILFDQYKQKGTRFNRPYQILIVDEVDSMFVDQKQHQTLIATTYPGFSELIHVMKIIWNKINSFPLLIQNKKYMMLLPVGKDSVKGQALAIMEEVIKEVRKHFKNEVIPQWREQFVKLSTPKWIQSAVRAAFEYKLNHHYVIQNRDIVPVDAKNTGCLQRKTHWQNGLHQFLQIKHGLHVSTQGMTSNFISNLGHFDKYKILYGLTGTLGQNQSKKFLIQTYKVQLMEIPPFKKRVLDNQIGVIKYNQIQWAKVIIQSIQMMCACQRSVLVICETIMELQLIKLALQQTNIKIRQSTFIKTGQEQIPEQIDCQEVIVATNLAGRGTDLKITQRLNQRGGLHVIIGFMPNNSRVQMQGRGRAGRNGCNGSSSLVVNYEKYCEEIGLTVQKQYIFQNSQYCMVQGIKDIRNQIEVLGTKNDLQKVKELRSKDKIFGIYCKGIKSITDFQTNHVKRLAIQEQWAMFLKRLQFTQVGYQDIQHQVEQFVKKLVNKSQQFYNPNHYVDRGINEIRNGNHQVAINFFKDAQKGDSNSLAKITGGIYQNIQQINQDSKNPDVINKSMKGLANVQQDIQNRKEIIKGLNVYNLQNRAIIDHHQRIGQQEILNFRKKIEKAEMVSIEPLRLPALKIKSLIDNDREPQVRQNPEVRKIPEVKKIPQVRQNPEVKKIPEVRNIPQVRQNPEVKKIPEVRKIELEDAESKVLSCLSNHIQQIQQKYKNLKKGQQYIEFNYKPISQILQDIGGNQEEKQQNKKAVQKLAGEGLRYLPVPQVKKIQKQKIGFWKRVFVFTLGILQIVVGAIIIGSTNGALSSFGVNMMLEGAKDCFSAIFNEEALRDLGKYYGQKALSYTFALATSGLAGIKQLAQLSQKGFTIFKNLPFGQFVKSTFVKAGSLMQKQGIIQIVANGLLNQRKGGLEGLQNIENPIQIIKQRASGMKKQFNQYKDQQFATELNGEDILNNFQTGLTQEIKRIISDNKLGILALIKSLPMSQEAALITLNHQLNQKTIASSNQRQIMHLLSNNIKSPDLANIYINHIKLKEMVENCVKNLKNVQKYQQKIEKSYKDLTQKTVEKIFEESKAKIEVTKRGLEKRFNELKDKDNTKQVVNQYNTEQQNFNNIMVTSHNYIANNFSNIYQMLKNAKCFDKNGIFIIQNINKLPFPEILKQGLRNMKFNSSETFKKSLETVIYNSTVIHGAKTLSLILNDTKGIEEKVADIAKRLSPYA